MRKLKKAIIGVLASAMLMGAMTGCGKAASDDITVISREDGSGTRGAFIELFGIEEKDADGNKIDNTISTADITNSTSVMMTSVADDTAAIGYISLGSLDDSVKAVKIDGAEASAENVSNGTYKVSRPFNIATKGTPNEVTQDFINFILSADGQAVVDIRKIGFVNFIFGKTWMPGANKFGIFPMIIGSIYVTAGAIIIGVPIGLLCAIFMAKFCPPKLHRIMKPAVDLLAGIPSIVYGFFGLVVITPMVRNAFGGSGKNILTACILLGIMILPTIISVSESAIRAVPESYYEGALALGDTHERSVFKAVLPAAKSGILAAIILGIGRAIGETMAVIMIAGNHPVLPDSLLAGVRTLTSNIVLELGYATDLHREALIATGVVLFVFILIINLLFSVVKKKGVK